jgi:hypothetical protein
LLSLLVVPPVYTLIDDLERLLGRVFKRSKPEAVVAPAIAGLPANKL